MTYTVPPLPTPARNVRPGNNKSHTPLPRLGYTMPKVQTMVWIFAIALLASWLYVNQIHPRVFAS